MHNMADEWFAMQAAGVQPWLPRSADEQRDQSLAQARLARMAGVRFGLGCYVAPDARVFTRSLVLGDRSWIASGAILRGDIEIGADCSINPYAHLAGRIAIGADCRIGGGAGVFGFEHGHDRTDLPIRKQSGTSRGVVIEDDVMVGPGAILLDGVRIGAHSVVQPGALVQRSAPPFSVLGGNPAIWLRDRRGVEATGPDGTLLAVRPLLFGADPYLAPAFELPPDPPREAPPGPPLDRLIAEGRPAIVVQLGAADGAEAIGIARFCADLALPAEIVCVDTWLGGWSERATGAALPQANGFPTLYWRFLATVGAAGQARRITPLSLPATAAARLFGHHGLAPDLVHIAAGAPAETLAADAEAWLPVLAPGGAILPWPAAACADEAAWVCEEVAGIRVLRGR